MDANLASPHVQTPALRGSLNARTEPSALTTRIASLDQYRGYSVAGMFVVNFLAGYTAIPAVMSHHNTYCSYADTIMPQFFLAVGLGYRLSIQKRSLAVGPALAYRHVAKRCLGLMLLGFVLYHLDGEFKTWDELRGLGLSGFFATAFQRSFFQTLVHIALASLWVLPVIGASSRKRIAYMLGSALLHLILSKAFYYEWVWNRPGIDGGPLGFLTWSIPILVGSLAFDTVSNCGPYRALGQLVGWSIGLMALGYGLSCVGPLLNASTPESSAWLAAPPFVPPWHPVDLWTMSQRAGSVSYLTFVTGFGLAIYALFVLASDIGPLRLGVFRTFGRNALIAYVLHGLVARAVKPYVPKDAPLSYALAGFALFFAITYLFVRHLEKEKIYIRL